MIARRRDADTCAARARASTDRAACRAPAGRQDHARSNDPRRRGPDRTHYFDAEDPRALARLADPMLTLEPLRGVVVIDEAQRLPDLLPVLRVLADRTDRPARFLVLGSASPGLVGLTSESLAGRVEIVELGWLRSVRVGADRLDLLWRRGGLPPAFTALAELRRTRSCGVTTTSPPSSSAIWPSSVCAPRRSRCGGPGQCSPISTARRGTAPSSPGRSRRREHRATVPRRPDGRGSSSVSSSRGT